MKLVLVLKSDFFFYQFEESIWNVGICQSLAVFHKLTDDQTRHTCACEKVSAMLYMEFIQ